MDNLKQRGRSRKRNQNRFLDCLIRGNRRKLSALLCASMVLNGTVTTFPVMAAEAENGKAVQEIRLESSRISEAFESAVQVEDNFSFEGANKASFESLLNVGDGNLYQLPEAVSSDGNLDIQVYVQLSQLPDEEYVPDESDRFIFLLINDTDEDQSAQIIVNDKQGRVIVVPAQQNVPLEEEEVKLKEEPTAPVEEPTEPAEEPTTPVEEPTAPAEEPTTPVEDPTEPAEEPTAPSEEPTTPVEEPTEPAEEPTAPSEEPTTPVEDPTEPAEEPTAPVEDPTEPAEEPTAPVEEEPEVPTEEPTAPAEEKPEAPVEEAPAAESDQTDMAGDSEENVVASISLHNAPMLAAPATEGEYEDPSALLDGKAVVYFTMTAEELGLTDLPIDFDGKVVYAAPEAKGSGDGSDAENATTLDKAVELLNAEESGGKVALEEGEYLIEKVPVQKAIQFEGVSREETKIIVKGEVNRNSSGETYGFDIATPVDGTISFSNLSIEAEDEGTYGVLQLIWIHNTDEAGVSVEVDNCNLINIGEGGAYRHAISIEYASGPAKYYFDLAVTDCYIETRSYGIGSGLNNGSPDVSDCRITATDTTFTGDSKGSIYNIHTPKALNELIVENCEFYGTGSGGIKYIYSTTNTVKINNNIFNKPANSETQFPNSGTYAIMATTQQSDLSDPRSYSYATELNGNVFNGQNTIIAAAAPLEVIWFPDGHSANAVELNNYGDSNVTDEGTRYGISNYGGNGGGFIALTDFGISEDEVHFSGVTATASDIHYVYNSTESGTYTNYKSMTDYWTDTNPRHCSASLATFDEADAVTRWTIDDNSIADFTVNHDGSVTIIPKKEGVAYLTAVVGGGESGTIPNAKRDTVKIVVGEVPTVPVAPEDWDISKTKEATNLDENYQSQITLSLPSAEEQLVTDVVFVLDKSTSADVEEQILTMLSDLRTEIEGKQAKVKVGVVIFNREAHVGCGLTDLSTGYEEIEQAIKTEISSGTNLHAGLLAGKALLDGDTEVDANRKYLIAISDGITYIYGETPTAVALQNGDKTEAFAGPDNWMTKYGTNNAPSQGWYNWLEQIAAQIQADGSTYEVSYGTNEPYVSYDERLNHAMSIDRALYNSYLVYNEAKAAGYHCYADLASSNADHPWAASFMEFLAAGQTVDFSDIKNEILYLVDAGSYVEDYMGYVPDDYDFDFVNNAENLSISVGSGEQKTVYSAVDLGNGRYGFGDPNGSKDGSTYPYVVEYVKGNGQDEEHFVWHINVPVSNFAPVQFTYTVTLVNPHTEAEVTTTYGKYDRFGEHNYEGLYTNNSAELYPVDSKGEHYDPEVFNKPTVSYTVKGVSHTPAEWETSKSKTATELNGNLESTVTLGLPSAQETLESDVVFVLDKSTSAAVEDDALAMLDDLNTQIEETGAAVKVGVVIFNKAANVLELTPLNDENMPKIEEAIRQDISSGTNTHAGLLAAKEMLDNDTSVDANRKYMIFVSDGITYLFDETANAINSQQATNGENGVMAGNDCWGIRHYEEGGDQFVPSDWSAYLSDVGDHMDEVQEYIQPYGSMDSENHIPKGNTELPTTVDVALYKTAQVYSEMRADGYHCYAMVADTGYGDDYPWGPSFMNYLANGKEVSFDNIQNDILYLLDAGSRVVDVIGEGTSNLGDPYDFTFINDISRMNLTVDGVALDKEEIGSVDGAYYSYGFGNRGDGNYRFVVNYYPGGTEDTEGEHFVWEINEAISNFAPVQFQYVVRLTTAPTADGTHGQYDGNGEHNYSGLLTNKEATLYPVDSNGTTYPAEDFPKPTVSYTVDNGGDTPVDPDPDKEQFTITINYYRRSDNAVLRESETITLDADAAYNINDLVNMAISGYRWSNYSVPEGQTSDLTGILTDDLEFNVYYVRIGGGGNPDGGSGSSGGGPSGGGVYTPGGPGVTIEPEEVPLAPLPDTPTTIGEGEVPLSPLPKTGETSRRGWAVMMLSGALMAFAAVLNRKREEER